MAQSPFHTLFETGTVSGTTGSNGVIATDLPDTNNMIMAKAPGTIFMLLPFCFNGIWQIRVLWIQNGAAIAAGNQPIDITYYYL